MLLRLLHEQQQLRPAKVCPDCHTSAVPLLLLLCIRQLLLLLLRHSRQYCPAERVQVSTAAGQLDSKHATLCS
jgi:hypothetical protein